MEDQQKRIKELEAQVVNLKDQKANLESDLGSLTKKQAATEVYKRLLDTRVAGAIGLTGALLSAAAWGGIKIAISALTVGACALYIYKASKEMKYLTEKYVLPVKTFKFKLQK